MSQKPNAYVHVDMDGLWAIRRCYSLPEGDTLRLDPVWEEGIPQLACWFQQLGLPASFFVVGRDLFIRSKQNQLRTLHQQGFEIANHSHTHKLGITRLSPVRLVEEIQLAHELICRCGVPVPTGFRAPGYDVDERVLSTLRTLGYRYDASLLPTYLTPALRVADALMARHINLRKRQFGQLRYAVAPQQPYIPKPESILRAANRDTDLTTSNIPPLWEFPVSVITPFRFPLTASAIFALGPQRVCDAIAQHAAQKKSILLLLHGIDAVDCSQPIIFPNRKPQAGGFNLSLREKEQMILPVLKTVLKYFTPVRSCDAIQFM